MAVHKRKLAVHDKENAAKQRPTAKEPPAKKLRKDDRKTKLDAHPTDAPKVQSETVRNTTKNSWLKEDERAFPRGGGGVLTPLEHKQIQVQAARDVLFDDSGGKRSANFTGPENKAKSTSQKAKLPKKKAHNRTVIPEKSSAADYTERKIKVESLKPKVHVL